MVSTLVSGPAGAGKSEVARGLLAASLVPTIMLDFQTIYAALLGIQREAGGRFPERLDSDAWALAVTEYLRRAAITGAIEQDVEVIATNSDGNPTRRQFLLGLLGADSVEEVVDPGIQIVTERLSQGGELSEQCEDAISRWYVSVREQRHIEVRASANELHGVLIQEGRQASGGRRESFAPGSIEWAGGVDILTEHLGKPETRVTPERKADGQITFAAPLTPALREAWDAGKRYMSVEFHALEERTVASGAREVLRALVLAGAMVNKPEYDTAVAELRGESRKRRRRW